MATDREIADYRLLSEQLIRVARGLSTYYRIRRQGFTHSRYALEWGGVCLTPAQGHALMSDLARQLRTLQAAHPDLPQCAGPTLLPRSPARRRRPFPVPDHRGDLVPVSREQQAEIQRLWLKGYGPAGIARHVGLTPKLVACYVRGA